MANRRLITLLVLIAMCVFSWSMSKVYKALGNPFVPQRGSGLFSDDTPPKCWALTLRKDGTSAAVGSPCKKNQESKK
jgi:hypothetical protein